MLMSKIVLFLTMLCGTRKYFTQQIKMDWTLDSPFD